MRQLITPNPHIWCAPGWCLQYVRQAFGLPARHPTATAAWLASTSKHRDRNFPKGVWYPIWFSLSNEPAGHVALVAPDGSVFSTSDLSNTPHQHLDISDLMNYYARYGMTLTYLGWTEDVAGYPVITTAGLAAQGTTNPTQEDDMFEQTDRENLEKLVNGDVWTDALVKGINDKIDALVTAAVEEKTRDAETAVKVDELVGNAQKTFWNTEEAKIRLQNAEPAQLALQINAAGFAAEVHAELIKYLGGSK